MSTTIAEPPARPLDKLAAQINDLHRQAESAMRTGLEHALEAGRLLLEAKAQCTHGEWGAWIDDNCEFSDRTARAYMRIARLLPKLDGTATPVADLTFRRAMRAVASNSQKIAAVPERRRQAVLDAWKKHDCANAHQAVAWAEGDGGIKERPGCERCCRLPVEHEDDYAPTAKPRSTPRSRRHRKQSPVVKTRSRGSYPR